MLQMWMHQETFHNKVVMLTLFDSLQDCSFICSATKKNDVEEMLTRKLKGWFKSRTDVDIQTT